MSLSNFGSYLHSGIAKIFQLALIPLYILRRFSYSFWTIAASRFGQRGITKNPSRTMAAAQGILLKQKEIPVVVEMPIKPVAVTTSFGPNIETISIESDTTISIDKNLDSNLTIELPVEQETSTIAATTTTTSVSCTAHKRHSVPNVNEIEQYSPTVEKKPKLASLTVAIDTGETSTHEKDETLQVTQSWNLEYDPDVKLELEFQGKPVDVKLNMESGQAPEACKPPPVLTTKANSIPANKEKLRLNYFVGIQVNSPEVRHKVKLFQETMLTGALANPVYGRKGKKVVNKDSFRDAMIPMEKLHFTLHVMHLNGLEDIEKAKQVLQKVWIKFKDDFQKSPAVIPIEGVGHFGKSVIFAKIGDTECTQRLAKVADSLREEFEIENIVGETRPFKPHMTIAKISRSKNLYRMNVRTFPPEMWSGSELEHFGNQTVEELQLLSMQGDNLTGYYEFIAGFPLV